MYLFRHTALAVIKCVSSSTFTSIKRYVCFSCHRLFKTQVAPAILLCSFIVDA